MSDKTIAQEQVDALLADARGFYPACASCGEDLIPHDGELCGACATDARDRIKKLEDALRGCANLTRLQHLDMRTVREIGERVQIVVAEALKVPHA